jgi:hypothetical protein
MKEGTAKLAMTMKKLTNSERNEVTLVGAQIPLCDLFIFTWTDS